MIQGVVTSNLEAIIPLIGVDDFGQQIPVDAAIDTGFNGYITLPAAQIATLGLILQSVSETILANGQRVRVNVYFGKVLWHNQVRIVSVEESPGASLVGMSLLLDNLLTIDVRYNGVATISENP